MLFAFNVAVEASAPTSGIKNVIMMIPDGGGMASFYLADEVKAKGGFNKSNYPNATQITNNEMYLKDYLVGSETTFSANSSVTDSAAAGTALSTCNKTNNGMIGINPDQCPMANILEAAKLDGKKTGLCVTYEWTNATPATFSAHTFSRNDTEIIAKQMLNHDIDVVFGNTASVYSSYPWFTDGAFTDRGYKLIKSKTDLNTISAGDKLWGKTPCSYYDINKAENAPSLAELTDASIRALNDEKDGFFLMVEGSAVDGGGHNNKAVNMVSEYIAFDEAFKVALDFAKSRTDTAIIVMPDHDTGGLTYDKNNLSAIVEQIKEGEEPANISWETSGHTSRHGGVFMYLPSGVEYPSGIDINKKANVKNEFETDYRISRSNCIDNTAIPKYAAGLLGLDLNNATSELYVDVTDAGSFDATTGVFTFNDGILPYHVSVTENTSGATVDGEVKFVNGQLALHLNEKFYISRELLNSISISGSKDGLKVYADYNQKSVTIEESGELPKKEVTFIVTKPGSELSKNILPEEVVYLEQLKTNLFGVYKYTFKVDDGQIGDYNFYTKTTKATGVEERKFAFKNLYVRKSGENITNMSQLTAGDSIETVLNGFDSTYDGILVVAQYDEKGRLINAPCEYKKGTAVKYEDETVGSAVVDASAIKIKVFYIDKSTFAPFISSYEIN